MRLAELALISLPGLLLLAWFLGLRHASYRIFMAAALLLAALGGALYVTGGRRGFTGPYDPAHWQGGRVVPGQTQ